MATTLLTVADASVEEVNAFLTRRVIALEMELERARAQVCAQCDEADHLRTRMEAEAAMTNQALEGAKRVSESQQAVITDLRASVAEHEANAIQHQKFVKYAATQGIFPSSAHATALAQDAASVVSQGTPPVADHPASSSAAAPAASAPMLGKREAAWNAQIDRAISILNNGEPFATPAGQAYERRVKDILVSLKIAEGQVVTDAFYTVAMIRLIGATVEGAADLTLARLASASSV